MTGLYCLCIFVYHVLYIGAVAEADIKYLQTVSITLNDTSQEHTDEQDEFPVLVSWSSIPENCSDSEPKGRCFLRGFLFAAVRLCLLGAVITLLVSCVICTNRKYVCSHGYGYLEGHRLSCRIGRRRRSRKKHGPLPV